MDRIGLHPGVENRLALLEQHIWEARRKVHTSKDDLQKIDASAKVVALEKRYEAFEKRLKALNNEGTGLFARMKAGMVQVGFDVTTSFQSFVERLDSRYRAANLPTQASDQ